MRNPSKYDFLTDEQWDEVLRVLHEDIANDKRKGIIFLTPEDPREVEGQVMSQEADIGFELWSVDNKEDFFWTADGPVCPRPLSQVILDDSSARDPVEVQASRDSLLKTIEVLDAWLAANPA